MKLVLDMCLSIEWVDFLAAHGIESWHWSEIGDPCASDREILAHAHREGIIIFTNDLDFTRLLALTHAAGPSVLQIRGVALLPEDAGDLVLEALSVCEDELDQGALVVIDGVGWRARTLPIG